jgi:hypothetical protein
MQRAQRYCAAPYRPSAGLTPPYRHATIIILDAPAAAAPDLQRQRHALTISQYRQLMMEFDFKHAQHAAMDGICVPSDCCIRACGTPARRLRVALRQPASRLIARPQSARRPRANGERAIKDNPVRIQPVAPSCLAKKVIPTRFGAKRKPYARSVTPATTTASKHDTRLAFSNISVIVNYNTTSLIHSINTQYHTQYQHIEREIHVCRPAE